MTLHVKIASAADKTAVEAVLQSSYPALMKGAYNRALLDFVLPAMTRANPSLLASGTFYLAELEGEPAGCGGWTFEEPGSGRVVPGTAHVRHFGVAASATGRGIGRLIYARCERDARAAGVRQFECFSSLNGERFYTAMGFKVIKPIDVAISAAVAFPAILMIKQL